MLALRRPMIPEPASPVRPDYASYSCEDEEAMEQECQELVWALVRAHKPRLVVEIGSCRGSTTEVIGNALADNGSGRLVSIEIDAARAETARKRCAHLPVEVICASGGACADRFTAIDMLIVDGQAETREADEHAYAHALSEHALTIQHDVLKVCPQAPAPGTLQIRTPRGIAISQCGS